MNTQLSANQVFLRDYTKIYTGTNQDIGYETPFLGFITDTTSAVFKADKSTYFHFPKNADSIHLSATDLTYSGAFAGSMPYKSDRIFKKQAGYENDTPNGFSYPINQQNGIWLCAWLSGNSEDPTQTPTWMDRWYDPGSFDSTYTLFVCSNSAVYDTPSKLTFDPGVWYRYDHIGNNINAQIVDMIGGIAIHLDSWKDDTPIDTSGNDNSIYLQNYTPSCKTAGVNLSGTGLKLNGYDQYGLIINDDTFNSRSNITCNVWIKSSDWQKQASHHFLSNGLRGGWSIGYNNGFFNPLNVLVDKTGNIVFNNQTGKIYKDIHLPGIPSIAGFAVDSELYTWVLDNGIYNNSKHLYKIDYNGNIDSIVTFNTTINFCDLIIDRNNNVWITDSINVSGFDTNCNIVSTCILSGNKLVVSNSNNLTSFDAKDACIFDDNYYWTVDNKGDVFYSIPFSGTYQALANLSATNVYCSKDFVWVLCDTNKIIQFKKEVDDITNNVTFIQNLSTSIADNIVLDITGRNIFCTNELKNNENTDYVWILQPNTGYLYKYDTQLNLSQKINITYTRNPIQDSAVRGDASGYTWHRLFNFSNLTSSQSQIEASVYLSTDSISSCKYIVSIPVTSLTIDDWHMFTFDIDTDNNKLNFYLDTILQDTISIPTSSSIFYKYETPFVVGTNIGHIDVLDKEVECKQLFHSGVFDDLRIYTNIINNSDIRHIYLDKYTFKDLIWNMPTGDRSYIEEIVKFFKFKTPGQKSQFYNIHLKGLQIQDVNTRYLIEDIIKNSIQKIAPIYTSLYKIIWD